MKRICWLVVLCLGLLITHAIAKPGSNKPATPQATIDFSELDKLVPKELKEKEHARHCYHAHDHTADVQ